LHVPVGKLEEPRGRLIFRKYFQREPVGARNIGWLAGQRHETTVSPASSRLMIVVAWSGGLDKKRRFVRRLCQTRSAAAGNRRDSI
jgi:hypothetical protein